MILMLYALAGISLLELAIFTPLLWSLRRIMASSVLIGVALLSGGIVADQPSILTGLFFVVSLYRIFNMLRLVEGRLQSHHLQRVGLRTSLWLIGYQISLLAAIWATHTFSLSLAAWWLIVAVLQTAVAMVVLIMTHHHIRAALPPNLIEHYSNRDLPSISVCVPARNETESLKSCLETLVASDYPKLEILVLDDCSQDKTSEIIRSFAHDGVRFIKGETPPGSWLAKNWAYQQLFEQASGELLVFCGVDIRVQPTSLRALVTTMLIKNKRMLSIVPKNRLQQQPNTGHANLIQPVRYAWELCLPRKLFNRPPVLSSLWVTERGLLDAIGSFKAVSTSVSPESHVARAAIADTSYSFLQSTEELGISSQKSFQEQWETAVRTRYPQLHRKPELVLLVSLLELVTVLGPFGVCLIALFTADWPLVILSAIAIMCITAAYARIIQVTYGKFAVMATMGLLPAVMLDIWIRHYSMWSYEFREVIWKGRNICLPVMHVIPRLPKI